MRQHSVPRTQKKYAMHPGTNKLIAVVAILSFCLGVYEVGQSVALRLLYVPIEGTLTADPAAIRRGAGPLTTRRNSYIVSYEYTVGSKVYSDVGETNDQPRDGVVDVFYRRDSPSLSTVKHPDQLLLDGGFMFFGGIGLLVYAWSNRKETADN